MRRRRREEQADLKQPRLRRKVAARRTRELSGAGNGSRVQAGSTVVATTGIKEELDTTTSTSNTKGREDGMAGGLRSTPGGEVTA